MSRGINEHLRAQKKDADRLSLAERSRQEPPPQRVIHMPDLIANELSISRSEGRRLVSQGAVRIEGERLWTMDVPAEDLRGKRVKVGRAREFVAGEEG